MNKNTHLARAENIPWRLIENEAILVNIDTSESIYLNETAASIWEMLDGKKTIEDIIDALCRDFEIDRQTAEEDTMQFAEKLVNLKMVNET